jgi:hypothetical protein
MLKFFENIPQNGRTRLPNRNSNLLLTVPPAEIRPNAKELSTVGNNSDR